jgi:hypothetical protein
MRTFFLWLALILAGLTLGIGSALISIRSGDLGNDIRVGPWTSGRDVGTADADIRTRAIVALRGLLALPASEARYFTARVDSAGSPLIGNCHYTVSGGFPQRPFGQNFPARWVSITVYDEAGWLIPNEQNRHSLGSWFMGGPNGWTFALGPTGPTDGSAGEQSERWIPTGTSGPIELTLRAYLPSDEITEAQFLEALPTITRQACRP